MLTERAEPDHRWDDDHECTVPYHINAIHLQAPTASISTPDPCNHEIPFTHHQCVCHEVANGNRSGAPRLVPHRDVGGEIRVHAPGVVRVHDPHLLPEVRLCRPINSVENEQYSAKSHDKFVRMRALPVPHDVADDHEVHHELNACQCAWSQLWLIEA